MKTKQIHEFNIKKISELCKIFSGGTPSTKNVNYWDGNIPWLSSGETRNNFIVETERKITSIGVVNSNTKLAKKDDIVIASAGQGHTRGQVSFCLIDTYVNQSIVVLRVNKQIIHPKFLFYNLKSRYEELRGLSDAHSSRGSLPKNILVTLDVAFPTLTEQEKIGKILYELDLKIYLNEKMNKTLEQIAQTVFKSWFVDYEFPDENGNPYKSSGGEMEYNEELEKEVPKGWELKTMNDVVTIKGGTTPSTKIIEYWDNGKIYWCTPKDLSNLNSVVLLTTKRKITKKGLTLISSGILPIGTILLSSRAPIGYLAITEISTAINQGFIAIICNKTLSKYFMLFWILQNMNKIKTHAQGTTFQEINKTNFRKIHVLEPRNEVILNFNILAKFIYQKITNNEKELNNLSQLRDSLLPKLMSGEIRV